MIVADAGGNQIPVGSPIHVPKKYHASSVGPRIARIDASVKTLNAHCSAAGTRVEIPKLPEGRFGERDGTNSTYIGIATLDKACSRSRASPA